MAMPASQAVGPVKSAKKLKRKRQPIAYAYLAPALISIAILSITPMVYTAYLAFTNFDMYHFNSYQFVGFQNFSEIISGPFFSVFSPTLVWTFLFAFLTTAFNYFTGLFLAVLLNNKNMKESYLYRAILIIPWAIPALISQLSWQGLLNTSYGAINILLQDMGMHAIPWLTDPFWGKVSILLVNLWLGYPYMMTICLGGLQAIPNELYEAAAIDGANWWQQFTQITTPALWKITVPLIVPTIAFNFTNFGAIYYLTQGGPARTDTPFAGYTDILVSAIYKMTLTFNKFELAAALSIIVFIIVAVISFINMKLTGAFEEVD